MKKPMPAHFARILAKLQDVRRVDSNHYSALCPCCGRYSLILSIDKRQRVSLRCRSDLELLEEAGWTRSRLEEAGFTIVEEGPRVPNPSKST